MSGRVIVGAVIAAALMLVGIPSSFAKHCCDRWGNVGAHAFISAGISMANAFLSFGRSVDELLAKIDMTWAEGFAGYVTELTKRTAAEKTFWEGQLAVHNSLLMQEHAAEATINGVPPAQQALTVSNAAILADHYGAVRTKLSQLNVEYSNAFYVTQGYDPTAVVKRHSAYCSAGDAGRGRCEKPAADTMQNADLRVDVILNPGQGHYDTLSDQEIEAARAFVQNVVQPIPLVRPTMRSDQSVALEAQLLTDQAALSLAANSFYEAIVFRTRRLHGN